jgi:hypothetical protein
MGRRKFKENVKGVVYEEMDKIREIIEKGENNK